ncbi:hypothetical protein FQN60_011697 [Etheostoma spectabile]|uniref:Uncharacterized protein n=1 Tax=Etheostoma spectabile TaxID=54343 RepID=A0A5J5DMN0_9PERO|nr:hypothetical protein FQN60_011697 [Etheostoma spectabile]
METASSVKDTALPRGLDPGPSTASSEGPDSSWMMPPTVSTRGVQEPGGQSGRRPSDTADTRRVFGLCAFGSDASAHLSGQISNCSPPMSTARVFTAVDGRPLLPCSFSTTLPLHPTRGQLWSNQQGLLVKGQMTGCLAVSVVTEKGGVVVKVWHVAVVSSVRGHSLRWYEPAVWVGHHGENVIPILTFILSLDCARLEKELKEGSAACLTAIKHFDTTPIVSGSNKSSTCSSDF